MNILDFKKMNIYFNEQSGLLKNEHFLSMNVLDFYELNNFLNKYLGFSSPASKWLSPNVSNKQKNKERRREKEKKNPVDMRKAERNRLYKS